MKKNLGNLAIAQSPTVRADLVSGGPPAAAKPRLLLVDDERQVLDGLALHLCRKYEVVARTSGAAALEALSTNGPFSAVISDQRMPHMSGVELLAEVRVRAPDVARVLLTGYADLTSAIAAVNDAGVHRFLTKPCPPAQLAKALDEALESAKRSRGDEVDEQMTRLGRQATLGTMAGSIGHEIGNLVASLAGSLELVQQQVDRGELPASEDIGLADPFALRIALDAAEAFERLGYPEGKVHVAQAAVYLARAKKSNALYLALGAAEEDVERTSADPVPLHLRNAATRLMKEAGYGAGYRYAHDDPKAKDEMVCLPPSLAGRRYFVPKKSGEGEAKSG